MWLKPLMVPFAAWFDDWIGNGRRNPAKKWWLNHEIVGGITVAAKATNEREIDPGRKVAAARQKMAYYHANMMPAPNDQGAHVVDRKAAMAAGLVLETPDEARARCARGEPTPAHYRPTQRLGMTAAQAQVTKSPYD